MQEEFNIYVRNYPIDNSKIKRKIEHSYRVMELSKKYATILGFNDYDIKLATLIGLIHDIGRFEQVRVYNTFNDRTSIDHADYGVKVLFEDGIIKRFWDNEDDYELIKFAIINHDKYDIPKIDDDRILKFAKLIRDVDKIDILYLLGYLKEVEFTDLEDEISKEILDEFYKHTSVSWKNVHNKNDGKIIYFAYPFDINYDVCLEELKTNLSYFYEYLSSINNKFDDIYKESIKYIDERMKLC